MLRGRGHLPVLLYRWLALVVGTIGYLVGGPETRWPVLAALGAALLHALAVTAVVVLIRPRHRPWAGTAVLDGALGALLVALTGGVESPFLLYYLIPALQAALWGSLQAAIGVTIGLAGLYPLLVLFSAAGRWTALLSTRFLMSEGLLFLLAVLIITLIGPALRWREQEGELARYEYLFTLAGTQRPAVLAALTEETLRALDADIALFFLRDPESKQLRVQVPDPYPLATLSATGLQRGEWDQEFLENLLSAGSPALLVDRSFNRFPVPDGVRRLFRQQPFLAAPLVLENEPIGLLLAGGRRAHAAFGEADLNRIADLAARTARVIGWTESLYSLRRGYAEMSTVNRVLREINSPRGLDAVLQQLAYGTREVLHADRVSVMLLDDGRRKLFVRAVAGTPFKQPVSEGVPLGQGVSGWVAQHDQPLLVAPENLARFRSQELREVQQAICVPLRLEGQVIGVLNSSLLVSAGRAFSPDDMHMAQILADAAATAIAKADLLEKLSARTGELSQANRELALQRNKLQWTIDSLAEGVFVLDAQDRLTLLNGVAAEQLGVKAETMIGSNFAEYLRQQGLEELRVLLQRIRSEATPHSGAVLYRGPLRADSDQVLELRITPICVQGEGGARCEGTVTAVRDVTVEVQQEQARSQFVAQLAQEIRTPLTVIKGYIDLLRGREPGPLTPQQEDFLGRVGLKLEEAVGMISGLLDLSRVQEGHVEVYFEPVDVAAVVRAVGDLVRPQAEGKRLDLRIALPPPMAPILAGRAGLQQVLLNLLENAIKHTSTQGQILLRVEDEGAQVKFSVQDTGLPIPVEARSRIFQREGGSEGRGRSSIGLYVAKQIVEAHRGAIWFESEPGKGTIFYFTLPKDPTQGAVEEGQGA